MVPPEFNDIAKLSKDLLSKDFPVSSTKLEVKTVAPNGVQFNVTGLQPSSGAISGKLEGKYVDKANGLTFTQSWDTINCIDSKVELLDQVAKGIKIEVSNKFSPGPLKSQQTSVLLAYLSHGLNCNAKFDALNRSFTGNVSVGHDGFIAGAEVGYNVKESKISQYSAAIGYSAAPYSITLQALRNLSVYSASYHHKVSPVVEASSCVTWDAKASSNNVLLEIGSKYTLDAFTYVKGKISNAGRANVSYFQTIRPGVKVGFGMELDTYRLQEPAHKVGFSVAFEG